MIFCTNKTFKYRKYLKSNWHRWFAWYPVTVEIHPDGSKTKIWLQWIERKGKYYGQVLEQMAHWEYEYRIKQLKKGENSER